VVRTAGAAGILATAVVGDQTAIVHLTAASGTPDNTVVDVGGGFVQATLNNNFADLAAKINAILTALEAAGLLTP
jgi:predicted flavoprotein YhiN